MKSLFIGLALITLIGCQHTQSFTGPNGELVHETSCNGTARTYADCFRVANEVCKGEGYTLISKDDMSTFMTINNNLTPIVKRSIVYTCK